MDGVVFVNRDSMVTSSDLNNTRDWLELPDSILCIILEKLMKIQDYIRFGAVCKSFRSIYIESRVNHIPRDPILLMLPPQHNTNNHGNQEDCSIYSLSDKKVYDFQVSVPHYRFCFGSNYGWLITYSNKKRKKEKRKKISKNFQVCLVNPFLSTNNEIKLPPMPYWGPEPDMFIETGIPPFKNGDNNDHLFKAVLSANPISDPNYVVIASHGDLKRLSIFRAATKSWTHLNSHCLYIVDVIFHKDKVFAVNYFGHVFTFDINDPNLEVLSLAAPDHEIFGTKYLVLSKWKLFQVVRNLDYDSQGYKTVGFTVLKLSRDFEKWDEVRNIGGRRMFFVGDNCSVSLSVSDLPGCKPNCIYFTDDYKEGYLHEYGVGRPDIGVFNLENGKIEPHYPIKSKMFPAPIFVQSPLR